MRARGFMVVGASVLALAACESSVSPVSKSDLGGTAGTHADDTADVMDAADAATTARASTAGATDAGSPGMGMTQTTGMRRTTVADASAPHDGQVQVSDVVAYENLAQQVQSAAETYRRAMMAGDMTLAGCASTQDKYDATARPLVSQMLQNSGEMDAFMNAHDGGAHADFTCTANAMMEELDRHRLVACTFSELDAAQAEATRDADVIAAQAEHVYRRCGQMRSGMGGHGYMWQDLTGGCAVSDRDAGDAEPATLGQDAGDADRVALGQRIFDSGIGADGQPIARTTSGRGGMMGGNHMGMASACANCHGRDGHGRTTMMFAAPDITYANLTDQLGMREVDGTRGHVYTDALIRRAVVEGIGADGDVLDSTMPRWKLNDEDWNDLLAYLKTLP